MKNIHIHFLEHPYTSTILRMGANTSSNHTSRNKRIIQALWLQRTWLNAKKGKVIIHPMQLSHEHNLSLYQSILKVTKSPYHTNDLQPKMTSPKSEIFHKSYLARTNIPHLVLPHEGNARTMATHEKYNITSYTNINPISNFSLLSFFSSYIFPRNSYVPLYIDSSYVSSYISGLLRPFPHMRALMSLFT